MLVEDFIQEFRDRIGDSSKSVLSTSIISWLNTALRRVARTEGCDKLFEFRDTFELAAINKDGTPSAAWDLGKIGTIVDIKKVKFLADCATGGTERIKPKYLSYDDFFDCVTLPEDQPVGDPNYYTIEQIGGVNRILFNRPPGRLVAVDMKYTAFHPRISSIDDSIRVPYAYCDIFVEYCIILQKIETTDQSTARALYEDLDLLTTEIAEMLARQKSGLPFRRIKRSF